MLLYEQIDIMLYFTRYRVKHAPGEVAILVAILLQIYIDISVPKMIKTKQFLLPFSAFSYN